MSNSQIDVRESFHMKAQIPALNASNEQVWLEIFTKWILNIHDLKFWVDAIANNYFFNRNAATTTIPKPRIAKTDPSMSVGLSIWLVTAFTVSIIVENKIGGSKLAN